MLWCVMEIRDDVSQQPCFDVDGMLGRLAKWLRILGFDAAYPRSAPTADRYFVTTRKQKGIPQIIIVTANDSMEQLKQVLTAISVRPDPSLYLQQVPDLQYSCSRNLESRCGWKGPGRDFRLQIRISRMSSVQASILGRLPFESNKPTPQICRSCLKVVLIDELVFHRFGLRIPDCLLRRHFKTDYVGE